VSVVVPVYDEGAGVEAVVRALHAQLLPGDELVVVDDASTDDTLDRLRALALPGLVVVARKRNGGPSAARNAGIARARNELVVCTDAGNDVPAGWLQAMRAALGDSVRPDLVAGGYRAAASSAWEHAMAVALYPDLEQVRRAGPLLRAHRRIFGGSFTADRPSGRSLAVRRTAWERVGGFPEHLRSAEDTTFGLAVAREGRCVVQTDEPVAWHQRSGWRATARMFASYGRGDGLQGERVVAVRNGVRALAAVAGPAVLLAGNRPARALVLAGATAYLGPAVARARRTPQPLRTAALVPVALATQDLAKAYGFLHGVLAARRAR
jgi:glycosyltransferase involved in cell wall biosynthesis